MSKIGHGFSRPWIEHGWGKQRGPARPETLPLSAPAPDRYMAITWSHRPALRVQPVRFRYSGNLTTIDYTRSSCEQDTLAAVSLPHLRRPRLQVLHRDTAIVSPLPRFQLHLPSWPSCPRLSSMREGVLKRSMWALHVQYPRRVCGALSRAGPYSVVKQATPLRSGMPCGSCVSRVLSPSARIGHPATWLAFGSRCSVRPCGADCGARKPVSQPSWPYSPTPYRPCCSTHWHGQP